MPHLSGDRAELGALVAIFGTTISPYLFFWQTSEEVEEKLDESEATASTVAGSRRVATRRPEPVTRDHLRAMRGDVAAGMAAGVAVMFAIMVASAATLGVHGHHSIQTAEQAAVALRPIAGRFAGSLFAVGIVGTGLLAVPVLAGSTAYALSEAFRWNEGLSRRLKDAPGFYAVIAAGMVFGLAMNLAGVNPIRFLYLAAILNGLAAPPLLILIFLLVRSEAVMGGHRSGPVSQVTLLATIVLMGGLPVAYLLR